MGTTGVFFVIAFGLLVLFLLRERVRGAGGKAQVTGGDRDPVCGMEVAPGAAAGRREYRGRIYRFCSLGCLARFDRDPGACTRSQHHSVTRPVARRKCAASPAQQALADPPPGGAGNRGNQVGLRSVDAGRRHGMADAPTMSHGTRDSTRLRGPRRR